MRYRFIGQHRSLFSVKKMCQVLAVSSSGYYRWCKAPVSRRKRENERLQEEIRRIYAAHRGMVGSPMITADLHDIPEFSKVSRVRVALLMKQLDLRCRSVRKFKVTTLWLNVSVVPASFQAMMELVFMLNSVQINTSKRDLTKAEKAFAKYMISLPEFHPDFIH